MTKEKLYLEDVKIGDTFHSEEYTMTDEKIKKFANEFDPQVFHLDEDLAQETFFRGLSASGWHTASVTMRLIVRSVPFAHGIIGAGVELDWPNPVRPGDTLTAVSVVKDIKYSKTKPNQGLIFLETIASNQKDEKCIVINAKLLNFKRE